MAASLRSKNLYAIALVLIKTISMLIAFIFLIDTILCIFNADTFILTYIKEFVIIAYLYITSYLFQLCWRHRLFLHYIVVCQLINIYDYYIGIPVGNLLLCQIFTIVSVIYFSFVLYKFLKK